MIAVMATGLSFEAIGRCRLAPQPVPRQIEVDGDAGKHPEQQESRQMEQDDPFRVGLPMDAGDWPEEETAQTPRAGNAGLNGLADFARNRLVAMVEDARDSLVSQVRGLKELAELLSDNLPQAAAPVRTLVTDAVGSIDGIADALAEKSVDELVEDGRALVRAQPAAAVGIAIALGFLAGRFLKAARN
jgi:ElaB/YqjD/DUF883 family membrane-anchored ribosome-binding protein